MVRSVTRFVAFFISLGLLVAACAADGPEVAVDDSEVTDDAVQDDEPDEAPAMEEDEDPVVVVGSFGGTVREALTEGCFEPFTEETGIEVDFVEFFAGLGSVRAQIESGVAEVDLTQMNIAETIIAIDNDLIEPLNYDVMDLSEVHPNQYEHPYSSHGITFGTFAGQLAYDANKWPDDSPSSWVDFFDVEQYPGPRAMTGDRYALQSLAAATLARGVAPDDVFPIDIDAAFEKIDEIKPHVVLFYESGSAQAQAMITGEVDMLIAWSSRVKEANEAGANFQVVPETFIRNDGDVFVIPREALHPNNASRLAAYCSSVEPMAHYSNALNNGPTNLWALEHIDPDIEVYMSTNPTYEETTTVVDEEWYAERLEEVEREWSEYLLRD